MKRYEKFTMYATKKLNGAYRYKDYINIYPSTERNQPFEGAESLNVEISFEKEDPYFRFGYPFTATFLGKKMLETMHVLSLFLMYQIPHSETSEKSIIEFYKNDLPTPTGEPIFYQNTLLNDRNIDELLIPKDIDLMFESYIGLNKERYNTFRNAMYLFYTGVTLEQEYKSLSFLSLVSAIETLMKITFSRKGTKTDKFICFITKLSYISDEDYIRRLYKIRSKFVHDGYILLSDRVWDDERLNLRGTENDNYFDRKNLIKIVRVALINWLVNNYRNDNNFKLKLKTVTKEK